jgi:hypothetical protein
MQVTIPRLNARGLETDLGIDGRTIAFDRGGAVVGPVQVVIVWARRQPTGSPAGTTDVIGLEGELHGRPSELTVEAGDLFMIDGQTAEVTVSARTIDGVAVAGFRLTTSGGD